MPDHARLAIVERLLPERAGDDPAAVMLDLHMMAVTGGRVRGLQSSRRCSQAGLAVSTVVATGSASLSRRSGLSRHRSPPPSA